MNSRFYIKKITVCWSTDKNVLTPDSPVDSVQLGTKIVILPNKGYFYQDDINLIDEMKYIIS